MLRFARKSLMIFLLSTLTGVLVNHEISLYAKSKSTSNHPSDFKKYPNIVVLIKAMKRVMKHFIDLQDQQNDGKMNERVKKDKKLMKVIHNLGDKISMHDILIMMKKDYPQYNKQTFLVEQVFRQMFLMLFKENIDRALPIVSQWLTPMDLTFEDILDNLDIRGNPIVKPTNKKRIYRQGGRILRHVDIVLNIGTPCRPFPFNITMITDDQDQIVNIMLLYLTEIFEIRPMLTTLYFALHDYYRTQKAAGQVNNLDFISCLQTLISEDVINIMKDYQKNNPV